MYSVKLFIMGPKELIKLFPIGCIGVGYNVCVWRCLSSESPSLLFASRSLRASVGQVCVQGVQLAPSAGAQVSGWEHGNSCLVGLSGQHFLVGYIHVRDLRY